MEIFLSHAIRSNEKAESRNRPKTPICIWGFHGIGKTELVQAYAKNKNYAWAYVAPAQFEEMGDLVGMPHIQGGKTQFAPPEWVPTSPGPGILLIDDVNRADDRILRGIMQLLQNYELASWALPKGWQIVLTANPDGGDYSVTPMDDAMLTRMMHITMKLDVREWAKWAERNQVDERGINFVLTYPEIIHSGDRTTPRSLVQFFNMIVDIPDLEQELGLVQMLADACLDKETVSAFIGFVRDKLGRLPSPANIMDAPDFDTAIKKPLWEMVNRATLRVDILATLSTRLAHTLAAWEKPLEARQTQNIKSFILLDYLPNDLRLSLAQDLMQGSPEVQSIMADPELAALLLENM